jgi:hypothetical protein
MVATIAAITAGFRRAPSVPVNASVGVEFRLREAIAYLGKIIPKAEHDMPEVQTAADRLTKAADHDGPVEFLARPHFAGRHCRHGQSRR